MRYQLIEAIEALYVAFGDAQRPTRPEHLDICPCCVSEEHFGPLLTKSVRSLTGDELVEYFHTATGAVTRPDFLYFFPRIAELLFLEDWGREWATAFARLGKLDADSWTEQQRSELQRFMSALIIEVSNKHQDPAWYHDMLEDVVCCHALAGLPMAPLLDELLAFPAVLRLFYEHNPSLDVGHLACYSCVPMPDAARDEIVAWLQTEPVLTILTGGDG